MKNLLLASSGAAFFAIGILSVVRPAQAVGLYGSYVYKSGIRQQNQNNQ